MANTNPLLWQDPHWGHRASSYHGPSYKPGRENIAQLQNGLYPPLGAMAISTSHALPQGWAVGTCTPLTPHGCCRTLLSLHEHLCPNIALKHVFLPQEGGLCYRVCIGGSPPARATEKTKWGERGGSASPPWAGPNSSRAR